VATPRRLAAVLSVRPRSRMAWRSLAFRSTWDRGEVQESLSTLSKLHELLWLGNAFISIYRVEDLANPGNRFNA